MADTSLAARLKARHPTYSRNAADWTFFMDSYMGGTTYTEKDYLYRHTRETPTNYSDRKRRAVFPNYSRKVIDIDTSFIFKDPIKRSSTDAGFASFESNADGMGNSLSRIMSEQVTRLGAVTGHVVVLVDLPKAASDAKTRMDDRVLGIRPYITVYNALDVVDWAIDANGMYTWVRFKECAGDASEPFTDRAEESCQYRTWTKNEWFLHSEQGVLLDEGTHNLGEVPAVFVPIQEDMLCMDAGESILTDIAPLNRAIYNYRSLLDEFLYRQCFNFLAFAADESLTPDRIKQLMESVGVNNATFYPAKGNPPSYVSPPSDPAEMIMKAIEMASREIIELAKLQDRKSSSAEKSGIAHAYEFQESNAAFAKIAKNLENAEKKIIRLFYKWQNRLDVPVSVQYPQQFNVTTLADQVEDALSLLALQVSDTFNKEVKKNIVPSALPGVDDEVKQTILEEIESEQPTDAASELARRHAQLSLRSNLDEEGGGHINMAIDANPPVPAGAPPQSTKAA